MEDHPHIPRPLVFLDYPISSITFEAELDLLRIQLRPCASEPRPCFQYSLLVVIPHGTCWPRARLLFHVLLSLINHIIIQIDSTKLEATESEEKGSVWTKTYRHWVLGRRCLFILSLSLGEVPRSSHLLSLPRNARRIKKCVPKVVIL